MNKIEQALIKMLAIQKYNWIEVARTLSKIKAEKTYKTTDITMSWTAWIKDLSKITGRSADCFFRMLSAYEYYCRLEAKTGMLQPIDKALLSKDTILLIKRFTKGEERTAACILNDVISGKFNRRALRIFDKYIGAEWERNAVLSSIKLSEALVLLTRKFINRKTLLYIKPKIHSRVLFDAVFVTDGNINGVVLAGGVGKIPEGESFVDFIWIVSDEVKTNEIDGSYGLISMSKDRDDCNVEKTPERLRATKRNSTTEALLCLLKY